MATQANLCIIVVKLSTLDALNRGEDQLVSGVVEGELKGILKTAVNYFVVLSKGIAFMIHTI